MRRAWLLLAVCGCGLDEWPGPEKHADPSAEIGAVRALGVGRQNACVVTQTGELWCWGDNGYGQTGDDPMTVFWSDRGKRNPQITSAMSVAVTDNGNICELEASGAVQCIGSGQALGDGSTMPRATFAPAAIGSVTSLGGGDGFCAVSGGAVSCWGAGTPFQPGYQKRMPTAVTGPSGITAVFMTEDHGCGVGAGGQLWCWGSDAYGQLGDGQCTMSLVGAVQSGSLTATEVGLSASATCTLTGGAVACFGNDVATGGSCVTAPVPFTAVSGAQHITGGDSFFCTLDAQGAVACWGDNTVGQLGTGTPGGTPTAVPQAVAGLPPAKLLAAAGSQACAVTTDDKVYCWGQDNGVARGATAIAFTR